MPTLALEPLDANETASMLADAGRQGLTLVPRGSGTKLGWTRNAAASDTYLSTTRINAPVQHFAGDLVATIPGGATLAERQRDSCAGRSMAAAGPELCRSATIGGIVATNDSGPRRHKYGAPRDLIIGVEMALSDGRVAKAGGRVVKNVAGYDLSRLVCGSFGTSGGDYERDLQTRAAPRFIANGRRDLFRCGGGGQTGSHDRVAAGHTVRPRNRSAIGEAADQIRNDRTGCRSDGRDDAGAAPRERRLNRMFSSANRNRALWQAHESSIWERTGLVAKIAVLPTDVESCLGMIAGAHPRLDWFAIGRAALGVLLVRVNAAAADTHSDPRRRFTSTWRPGRELSLCCVDSPIRMPER